MSLWFIYSIHEMRSRSTTYAHTYMGVCIFYIQIETNLRTLTFSISPSLHLITHTQAQTHAHTIVQIEIDLHAFM